MADIDRKTLAKLAKLIPLLSSNHGGEVAATAAAIVRTVGAAGASLHDIVALLKREPVERVVEKVVYRERVVVQEKIVYRDKPPEQPPAQDASRFDLTAAQVMEAGHWLLTVAEMAEHERSFIENMMMRATLTDAAFSMTAKQRVWFHDLAAKYRDRANG